MLPVRADFACLALNFTLCSVFTGRYFVRDTAERLEGPNPPSGFLLPDSRTPCFFDQWSAAALAIRPSLQQVTWSPAFCHRETDLVRQVLPRGRLFINGTRAPRGHAKVCAVAYHRKGSKLFRMAVAPTWRTVGVPCSGPGKLDVCHVVKQYSQGQAPNPFGEEASFVLGSQGKARKEKQRQGPGAPDRSKNTKKEAKKDVRNKAQVGSGGKVQVPQSEGAKAVEEGRGGVQAATSAPDEAGMEVLKRLGGHDSRVLVSLAVAKLNEKDYNAAIDLYSMLPPDEFVKEKLLGRGTAFLLSGSKDEALEDFNQAVSLFPRDADALRRRASAFENLGMKDEALQDLTRSLELDPGNEEARHMRGALAFNTLDYWTAIQDFNSSVQKRPNDPVILNALGLALMGSGKYVEAAEFYDLAVKRAPQVGQLWLEKGRSLKELGQVKEAERALRKALKLEKSTVAYHRLASLKQLTGHHKEAIEIAEEGLLDNPGDIELNFIAASSKHALGLFIEAVKHYDKVLSLNAGQNSGMLTQQFLAFYLREICSYTWSKANSPLDSFQLDTEMSPEFKVHWVKKMNPMDLFPGYQPVKISDVMIKSPHVDTAILTPEAHDIIKVADRIGGHAQYFVQGFMPNRRQYRMAGLAALDLMQRARATWQMAQAKGPGGKRSSSWVDADEDEGPVRSAGQKGRASKGAQLIKNWRGMFNTLVRWRQLSEPVDTIAWIDGLGKEYIAGFGSITAMTVGQMENLKYYPEYKRGFELMKQRLYDSEEAMNATGSAMHISREAHGEAILAAGTRQALWEVVGENFYVTTQCHSFSKPGLIMNGTQLTLVESLKSYDFAIRTPVTADRMEGFGHEMQAAWEDLSAAFVDEALAAEDPALHRRKMQDAILRVGYYWFQLMPLARGSAMVGLISLHGLSLAAGMEITEYTPRGLQIDWESILEPTFELFNRSVAHWFFNKTKPAPLYLPNVMQTLPSVKHIVAAMSLE